MSRSNAIGGTGTSTRTAGIARPRALIFQGLTLVGIALLLVSWFMPWWQAFIVYLKTPALYVHPWGAESFLPPEYANHIAGYEMPAIFMPLMRAYLILCVAALVWSLFARNSLRFRLGPINLPMSTALVLGVGISYMICVVVGLIVMQMRVGEFYNAPLIGTVYIGLDEGHKSNVDTMLMPGYYLAAATGPALIVLAYLRNFILGAKNS